VATRAGVTHGLVTHYFGTYKNLVHQVLGRRRDRYVQRAASRMADPSFEPGSGHLLELIIELMSDPTHARLLAWAALSADATLPAIGEAFTREVLEHAARARASKFGVSERAGLAEAHELFSVAVCAAFGLTVLGDSVTRALGSAPDATSRERLRLRLIRLVAASRPEEPA
jgi:TetR/AcrR family transcriptional regulator, repressor for neighboring sulfatase